MNWMESGSGEWRGSGSHSDSGDKHWAHFLRSQVGIGSESDCLLGKLRSIFETPDSVAGLKVAKLGGVVNGAGE